MIMKIQRNVTSTFPMIPGEFALISGIPSAPTAGVVPITTGSSRTISVMSFKLQAQHHIAFWT
jgi:hypothetical protein